MGRLILLLVTVCALTTFGQEIDDVDYENFVYDYFTDNSTGNSTGNSTVQYATALNEWLMEILNSTDPCEHKPCENGATCENLAEGGFKCHCPEPFKGQFCDRVKAYCKPETCGHGTCVYKNTHPYYECKCRHPYKPPDCKTGVACDSNPCQNGGTCVKGQSQNDTTFQCSCPSGYSGNFCEVEPNDCYEENGASYSGNVSTTMDGHECVIWSSYFVLQRIGNVACANSTFFEIHNFCRNPDDDSKPWCFINQNNRVSWRYCNIRQCPTVTEIHPTAPPTTPPDPVSFPECGKPRPGAASRIFFGKKAVAGVHPWQVSLQKRERNTSDPFRHDCGGTLLSSCWVLTAAHCVEDVEDIEMQVVLGGVDLKKDEVHEQFIPVEKVIPHEDYRQTEDALYNDIALVNLKVTEKQLCAKETRYVKTACLPDKLSENGTECVVSGWGKTEKQIFGSRYLMKARVFQISQEKCQAPHVHGDVVDDSMFCAGHMEGGADSCQGDSGGPLMCERDETHYVEGVVSWGDRCGKKFKPGVYASVPKFLDWIKKHMNS